MVSLSERRTAQPDGFRSPFEGGAQLHMPGIHAPAIGAYVEHLLRRRNRPAGEDPGKPLRLDGSFSATAEVELGAGILIAIGDGQQSSALRRSIFDQKRRKKASECRLSIASPVTALLTAWRAALMTRVAPKEKQRVKAWAMGMAPSLAFQ